MRSQHPKLAAFATATAIMCALLLGAPAASAHPHVWVTVKATVLYDNGKITGLQQDWTFDEMYTQMAIEGLDKNHDGVYDRQELAELAQVNIDGLKEFDYFTYAKSGSAKLKFKPPVDYWLEHKNGILTLHLTLPLEAPVAASPGEFDFQVFDPSYFIAFEFAKDNPVKLGAKAPAGCSAAIREPADEDDSNAQALNQAFSNALGSNANANANAGANGTATGGANGTPVGALSAVTRTVAVQCAKS
jgi:ABC-type uncharacterized transport system substrate-binding protein